MRFIHCADLHLDAGMESKLPTAKAKERREELLTAFARLARTASEKEVTAVIIAGDLFDRSSVTARAKKFFLETVEGTPTVDFLLLLGNHDARVFSESEELPANLKLFKSGRESFDYGEVTVSCTADVNAERTNIVVAHGAAGDDIRLEDYSGRGIDYLALGHYHEYKLAKLDERGVYCYSGCLEGRGFDEVGEKGYVMLEVGQKRVDARFVRSSIRQVVEVEADLSDAISLSDQKRLIEKALDGVDREDLVRLTVVGKYELNREKFYDNIVSELAKDFWYIECKDRSTLKIDPDDYVNDISLKGEFIRTVMSEIEDEDERGRIISLGIRALRGEDLS